jgi:glycosyltransferase involved in cell wall biosynthesis
VVAAACAGRPALLHHHDLPWQRPQFGGFPPPPDDAAWAHVTINALSRRELAAHGISATTVYNTFEPDPPPGRRAETRVALGVADGTRLLLQPTRALPRKNIEGGLALAADVGGTYWLLGPAEDGYEPQLRRLVRNARCPVVLGWGVADTGPGGTMADAYAACDAVLLPSTWEGFGNPSLESATHRRPLAIGAYPVASELEAYGFRWFPADDPAPLAGWLSEPDEELLRHNYEVAVAHFNVADLPSRLEAVLSRLPSLQARGG